MAADCGGAGAIRTCKKGRSGQVVRRGPPNRKRVRLFSGLGDACDDDGHWKYLHKATEVGKAVDALTNLVVEIEAKEGTPKIKIGKNEYAQRRKVVYFAKNPENSHYAYSGQKPPTHAFPPELDALAKVAEQAVKKEFNESVTFTRALVNLYDAKTGALGAHRDQDCCSRKGQPGKYVASFSFGLAWEFVIYDAPKNGKMCRMKEKIMLQPGSLLIMSRTMQDALKHAVPARKDGAQGHRLNITFRMDL